MTTPARASATRQALAWFWQRAGGMPRFARANRPSVPDSVLRAILSGGDWRLGCQLRTVSDAAVFMAYGPRDQTAVLKVATTEAGIAGLRREADVLGRLASDERLGGWRAVLPRLLDAGHTRAGSFLLTSRLPGVASTDLPQPTSRLTSAAIDAITPLHRHTRTVRVIDDELLNEWVGKPAERIRNGLSVGGGIGRLADALRAELAGRPVTLGWAHGDFHPGNLLFGADGRVTGIVDWGEAKEQDLAAIDVAFWLLTVPAQSEPREFGQRIAARLDGGRFWTQAESRVLAGVADADLAVGRTLPLLAWLRHVAGNLGKSDRYACSPVWSRRNVVPVLRQMAHA